MTRRVIRQPSKAQPRIIPKTDLSLAEERVRLAVTAAIAAAFRPPMRSHKSKAAARKDLQKRIWRILQKLERAVDHEVAVALRSATRRRRA